MTDANRWAAASKRYFDTERLQEMGFGGHWVATVGDQVVGCDGSPKKLVEQLRRLRIAGSTIRRVPRFDEPEMVGLG